MSPKKSQATFQPGRNLRTTARKSTRPTPSPVTTVHSDDHENANQSGQLHQQNEGNSSDHSLADPTTADVIVAPSDPIRPETSSERNALGSIRPDGHGYSAGDVSGSNNSAQFMDLPGPLRPEIRDTEMGVGTKSLRSEGEGSGSVRPEVDSYSAGVEAKGTGAETVGPECVANAVNGGDESAKEELSTGVGGSSGKKKVVKRVVRVVKKVVRKKVPKRVVEGVDEEQKHDNMETAGCVSGSMDADNASSSSIHKVGIENSKPNDDFGSHDAAALVVKEHSLAANDIAEDKGKESEVKEDLSGLGEVKMVVEKCVPNVGDTMNSDEKNENFDADMNVSESMVVDNDAMLQGAKNEFLGDTVIKSMEIEKCSSFGDGNAETENLKEVEVTEPTGANRFEDQFGSQNKDPQKKLPLSDKPVMLEGEKTSNQVEIAAPVGTVPDESERSQYHLEEKKAGAGGNGKTDVVEAEDDVPMVESSSGEGSKGMKEPSEDDSERSSHGLVWSGEMEALERRKRRKTQIFVGGLAKDAKEEDIRKVFEDVGEIVEVKLVMNGKTGKNKGFAFVRYASAEDAKKALTKYSTVKIRGKECGVSPVQGNDTLFLGNINRKWKAEDIIKLLKEAGIQKIDKVTVKANPKNVKQNRGFAFVELETCQEAHSAFQKLQKEDAFGGYQKVKVAWAQPLIEPDEEDVLKVKSVYAEYLPYSWGEEEVKDYFKRFGEIENVTLAKSLPSSKRNDFAFVNYTSREAAIACVKAFSQEQTGNDGLKGKMKVSLANPTKSKQTKPLPNMTSKELPKEKRKATEPITNLHEPRNKRKPTGNSYEGVAVDRRRSTGPSTTEELVQLLRQQAVSRQTESGLSTGSAVLVHQFPLLVNKQPFSAAVHDPRSSDLRGLPPLPIGRSYPLQSLSMPSGVSMASSSYHHQGMSYASESVSGVGIYPIHFQTRPQAFYHGRNGSHHR